MITLNYVPFPFDLYQNGKLAEKLSVRKSFYKRMARTYNENIILQEGISELMFVIFNSLLIFDKPQIYRETIRAWAEKSFGNMIIVCDDLEFENIVKFLVEKDKDFGDIYDEDTLTTWIQLAIDRYID